MLLALSMLAALSGGAPPPPATATPAPATSPTPTPVVVDTIAPKTLQDLARERKGRAKKPGSVSVYQGTPGGAEGTAAPAEAEGPRPSLRVVDVHASAGQKGPGSFVGSVKNVGTTDACEIRITVEAIDTKGKSLGTVEVSPGTLLRPGETTSFEGTVTTGPTVSKEEAELAGGAVEHEIRSKGGGVVGSFQGVVRSASGSCPK